MPDRLRPVFHRLAQSDVLGFENQSPKAKKSVFFGRTTADVSFLREGSSDVLDLARMLCCALYTWGYDAGSLELCSRTKKKYVMRAVYKYVRVRYVVMNFEVPEQELMTQLCSTWWLRADREHS